MTQAQHRVAQAEPARGRAVLVRRGGGRRAHVPSVRRHRAAYALPCSPAARRAAGVPFFDISEHADGERRGPVSI